MSIKFQKGNSVQGQGVGQANRCECKHVLLLLFQLSFLLCPSLHSSSRVPSPHPSWTLQQMMQQQAALMAATQGSYLNPMAAIAAAQMQQMAAFNVNGLVATPMTPSSGTTDNSHSLTHCSFSSGENTNCDHTHTRTDTWTCTYYSFPISQLPAWNVFIISRIIEAARTIIIQDISAFALVTFLRCRLQEEDGANDELMEVESRVASEKWLEKDVLDSLTLIGTTI